MPTYFRDALFGGTLCLLAETVLCQQTSGISAPQAEHETVIVRSDRGSLVFEYRPHYISTHTRNGIDGQVTSIDFAGAIPLPRKQNEGSPDLRFRQIPIAFPSRQGNTVRVVAADVDEIRDVTYAPVPKLRLRDGILEAAEMRIDPERYRSSVFLPVRMVELTEPGQARSLIVGGVRVFPIQYNPAARTVRKYTRIVIEVTFGAQDGRSIRPEDAALFKNDLLNYRAVQGWVSTAPSRPKTTAVSSVLASGDWYRITVADDGIYELDAHSLSSAGINVNGVDPRTIKIYGNGGTEVPEDPSALRPADLVENAIYVEGEADGKLDPGDYILFYGRAPRGWTYDPPGRTLNHYINHYSEVNYYWLTTGGNAGKRMAQQQSLAASPGVVAEKFRDGIAIEDEKIKMLSSGKDWYGQSLSGPSSSFTYVNVLPGLATNDVIVYRYALVAHSDVSSTFTVRESGNLMGVYSLPLIFDQLYATGGTFQTSGTSSLSNNTCQLNFAFSAASAASEGWTDWVEILYPRMLWAVNNYLRFRSPDTSAVVEYRLQQFSAIPSIFNVTVPENVRVITGVTGSYVFRAAETAGGVSEYCAAGPSSWKAPGGFTKVPNQDLHGSTGGADFIIMTSKEFRSAADRLKAYREQPANGNLKTIVTDVSQIYNEFGGGLPDVSAIRDYLKYAYDMWNVHPQFVLMLGGASYDYKGILGSQSSFVPTWESEESRDQVGSYATDDFYAKFGTTDAISLVLGRIPSRTTAEADAVLDKIIGYESHSARDSWKMRMLFVADDAWTPEGGEVGDETTHSDAAETLAGSSYTPDEFEKRKIYIAEYPTVNTAQGRRKPGAYQAIIDQINQGALVVNYSGHGNPTVWAHERIFEVSTSIPQLVNEDKQSVFFLATCNFSQFDDPKSYSGSELLMNRKEGGGVGVISADREVYAGDNAELTEGTYRNLFIRDLFGRVVVERPATALYLYKATGGGSTAHNNEKFFYMGDPTMRLQYPVLYASIDSINHQRVDSINGAPRTTLIQMKSLSRVTVSGTIRDQSNHVDPSFNGRVSLLVNDATRTQVIVDFYPGVNWPYLATGGTIYKGENSVANGGFSATFIVPKDIAYADSLSPGRVVAYVTDGSHDGAGYTGAARVGGTDSSARNDNQGPKITIYVGSRSFRPGDVVSENPMLYIDLSDTNGINTSGSGIGHRIEAWVTGSAQSIDVTDYFTSKLDNFREGNVQYQLKNLPQGKNSIQVRAWDSFNNASVAEVLFDVASGENLSIFDVLNYPNPFSSGTQFTFRQNQNAPLNIMVKIFTVAGRVVQTLYASTSGEPFVQIPWDGRDRDGDILANGVYLYKVIVKTPDGRFATEALGKLSLLK